MRVPLVLLPGMNCSARLWDGVIARLDADAADPRSVVVETLAEPDLDAQVEALLARLPTRFAIAGLSLGAIVAMAINRRAPDRVAGLGLVATNARPPTPEQQAAWGEQLERLAHGASARGLQDEILPLLVGDGVDASLREDVLAMADEVGSSVLPAQLRLQQSRVDERPALSTLTVPCVVVAGGDDRICPVDRHTEIHALATGSELVVVPGAPHLAPLTHSRPVADALAGWLARVDG